ncbi:MAG: hypothetical protein WAW21_13190, partial [Corynebacterium variabile]
AASGGGTVLADSLPEAVREPVMAAADSAFIDALHTAFTVAAVIAAIGLVAALTTIRRKDLVSTTSDAVDDAVDDAEVDSADSSLTVSTLPATESVHGPDRLDVSDVSDALDASGVSEVSASVRNPQPTITSSTSAEAASVGNEGGRHRD